MHLLRNWLSVPYMWHGARLWGYQRARDRAPTSLGLPWEETDSEGTSKYITTNWAKCFEGKNSVV